MEDNEGGRVWSILGYNASYRRWKSLISVRALSHERSNWVHLSIFQGGPIGPSILLYEQSDVNRLVSDLHPATSDQIWQKQM